MSESTDEQEGFSKGFDKIMNPTSQDAGEEETAAEPETPEATVAPDEGEAGTEERKEPDPLHEINERLASLESLPKRLRDVEGRVGGFSQKLETALMSVKDTTEGNSPSEEQIKEAAQSSEKFEAMKEEFPDFAEAVEEHFSGVSAAMLKNVLKREDLEKANEDVLSKVDGRISERLSEGYSELEERIVLRTRHPDWEKVRSSDEFMTWALEGGPSRDEYDGRESNDVALEWAKKYPDWWVNRGSKMFSPYADDAIELFDAYKKPNGEEDREHKQKRLKAAAPAPSAAGPTNTEPTAQQAFSRGFKRALGR